MLKKIYAADIKALYWDFCGHLSIRYYSLVVFTLVFSVIMKAGYEQYYMFLFVALVPWMFFASSVQDGSTSILREKDMVKKIYFPREVLPIATVTSGFVNMLLTFIVIFAALLVSGRKVQFLGLACLPVVMIVEYILCLGIALIVASLTVYLREFTVYSRYFSDGVTVYDTGDVRKRYGSGLGNADFQTQSDDTGDRNLS